MEWGGWSLLKGGRCREWDIVGEWGSLRALDGMQKHG